MQVYNTTNSDSADTIIATHHLTSTSAFYQEGYTLSDPTAYRYIMTARFLDWYQVTSGNSYKIKLSWINPSNPLDTNSVEYSWTISLTTAQQEQEQDNTQQQINQGIHDLNGHIEDLNNEMSEVTNGIASTNSFLNSTDIDPSIMDLPTLEINENISSYIDQLFNSIYYAFTSENPIDFVFEIPNSNGQTITIPSNYIESHIPNVILVLIRSFYWYMISRFVIKDIMHIINRMKQGDYFLGSDQEIKTEVL